MNKNMRFLSSVLVLCTFGFVGAHAAPSVRMLGTNAAKIGTNATVVRSDNANTNTSTQRLGTIRSKSINTAAPVINKVASVNTVTDSGSDARLSLGKYIHSTGVSAGTIKPATTGSSTAGVSSSDFVALSDQVRDLKNNKQDAITVGDGLTLNGSTISLDSAALQVQVEENVISTLGEDYYTADEIDEMFEGTGAVNQTYPSITPGISDYESINVADVFDEDFDFTD